MAPNHQPGGAGRESAARHGPQIVRIGDAVQDDQERACRVNAGFDQTLKGRLRKRVGPGHHSLRGVAERQARQLGPGDPAHGHMGGPGQVQDLPQRPRLVATFGHGDVVHAPPASAEQLADRLPSLDLVPPEGHRGMSSATARQAIPSRRPSAPSASARLALMLTGAPTTSASRPSMAWR